MNWKEYYTKRPSSFGETEFLKQVHKTVAGQPITQAQFAAQLSDIQNALGLRNNDFVLDLCCGNGIITTEMSKICEAIVGIDFSETLIQIANKYNKPENATYYCMSVLDIGIKSVAEKPFTKIYMYEALQHFAEDDLPTLLARIVEVSSPSSVTFLGGIPDVDKLWNFYDTEERREEYRIKKSKNQEAIGTWWEKNKLVELCKQNQFQCEVLPQNPELHSAHYRFDVRLTRQTH
jgi:cyclopropane fatty-acyl-phospholipid synthase-like methyltransferase